MTEELHFTVDSALLKELGEKLVETVHLALSELVKNAYDADATEVRVIFDNNPLTKEPRIIIQDNGIGMNFNEVQKYWMRIATTHKKGKNLSLVYGRALTGAKGIGRFSCRRLGEKLTLKSTGVIEQDGVEILQKTEVEFPWTEFEAGQDVTKITCLGSRDIILEGETGTTLIIDGIADEWKKQGMDWLKRHLAKLTVNRGTQNKGFEYDPGFNLYIQQGDLKTEAKNLRNEVINAGWGTLTVSLNDKSQAYCVLEAKGMSKKNITSSQTFPNLNDVILEVGIMINDNKRIRDKSVISQGSLNDFLDEWGGVQIHYRGFRVLPYGDDDWLKIEKERGARRARPNTELFEFSQKLKGVDPSRTMLTMLGMRNYIGGVKIGKDAKGFEMKSSREGFIESPAMSELKEFVRFGIDWATIMRDYSLRIEDEEAAKRAEKELEEIIEERITSKEAINSAVNLIEKSVKSLTQNLDSKSRKNVKESFAKATELIKSKEKSTQSQLNHLRLIASTSTLLLVFQHEVKSLLGLLEVNKNSLNRIANNINEDSKSEILEVGNNFTDLSLRLKELLEMTSLMTNSHKIVERGQVALRSRIEKVAKVFELITNKYNIEVDYFGIAPNIAVKNLLEAEVYGILLNVVSNSIKAVIATSRNRKVSISAKKVNEFVEITIRDNGIGLSENRFEEVFTAFVSDPEGELYPSIEKELNPEDKMIVGTGSGLGLGIVKEIVEANNGEITFKRPLEGWSSELIIKLK